MNNTPFVIEGDLWLYCQESGIANDAFVIRERELEGFMEQLAAIAANTHAGVLRLDDMVTEHFEAEREEPFFNKHIGQVRITIERIDIDQANALAPTQETEGSNRTTD